MGGKKATFLTGPLALCWKCIFKVEGYDPGMVGIRGGGCCMCEEIRGSCSRGS